MKALRNSFKCLQCISFRNNVIFNADLFVLMVTVTRLVHFPHFWSLYKTNILQQKVWINSKSTGWKTKSNQKANFISFSIYLNVYS